MVNSDNWYEPNAVELIVNAYKSNPDKRIFHGNRFDALENGTKKLRKFLILQYILYVCLIVCRNSFFI